jgi:cold shock CspA family protein
MSSRISAARSSKCGRVLLSREEGRRQHRSPCTSILHLPVSSSASSSRRFAAHTTGASSVEYVTGKVRNYARKKAFGFIIPDGEEGGEADDAIFVHRSGIKSTSLIPPESGSISNPYLLRNERVRFLVVEQESNDDPTMMNKVAKEVEYEDGSPIPIYRPEYVDHVKRYNFSVLGEVVYTAMEDEDIDDVADSAVCQAKIKAAYEKAKQDIADGQTRYTAMNELIHTKKKD